MASDTEQPTSQTLAPSKKHKKKQKVSSSEAKPEKPQKVKATIRVIPGNPDRIPPLVGYFPSGFDPTRNPDPDSAPKVGVFRHRERGGTRLQVVVTPPNNKVDFVGSSYGGEAQVGELCSYGLGVLDKETNTLKIVPIACNKVFRLEPKIQGLESSGVKGPEGTGTGDLSAVEKAEKRTALHNLYGTKKSIRQNKKMQTLKQEDDPDAENDLDAIKQGMLNSEETEAPEGQSDRNTPPFNASATSPHEAYPLDKIITTEEWKFLQNIYNLTESGSEISQDSFPTFVCNRIHKLQLIEDDDKRNKLACIFSYITHLIKFKDLHSMDGFSSAKGHKFPNIIRDKFSTMFDAVSKRLSTEKNNLLISYVLVLTLFADEFQTCMMDIAKDLRLSSATLRMHYETLGCKVSKKNDISTVTLPVPLKFPPPKRKRRNK